MRVFSTSWIEYNRIFPLTGWFLSVPSCYWRYASQNLIPPRIGVMLFFGCTRFAVRLKDRACRRVWRRRFTLFTPVLSGDSSVTVAVWDKLQPHPLEVNHSSLFSQIHHTNGGIDNFRHGIACFYLLLTHRKLARSATSALRLLSVFRPITSLRELTGPHPEFIC